MILPYLEQHGLYNAINMGGDESEAVDSPNQTVAKTALAAFLCPSDAIPVQGSGWTNYAGCAGYGYQAFGDNGMFFPPTPKGPCPPDPSDGGSNTAIMSEWLLGYNGAGSSTQLGLRATFVTPELAAPDELAMFTAACRDLNPASATVDATESKGRRWLSGQLTATLYNHVLTLNRNSCRNGQVIPSGAWTASSGHPGSANVLFADGHVRSVKETVEIGVWRALSTRAGGEVPPGDAF